uniref:Uncharacterized protein n=1 Tax=Arundo donax TaxID=35708 RepID=A0A0A9DC55_ARUDO
MHLLLRRSSSRLYLLIMVLHIVVVFLSWPRSSIRFY